MRGYPACSAAPERAKSPAASGAHRIALLRDSSGRYPDVTSAVPKSATTVVSLDKADAALVLDRLPVLSGAADENQPVTLDLAESVVARHEVLRTAVITVEGHPRQRRCRGRPGGRFESG